MRQKKKGGFKFAGKKHSRRGKISLMLALCSVFAGVGMVAFSIQNGGNASICGKRRPICVVCVIGVADDRALQFKGRKLQIISGAGQHLFCAHTGRMGSSVYAWILRNRRFGKDRLERWVIVKFGSHTVRR